MSGSTVATRYWHRTGDGRVQCDVCPRACRLHEGQRGFCFVRMRQDDAVVLTSYGRSSGFCVDPIEKKPLNHFLPGSAVLSFGTAGCNLGCRFCQNWDISKSRETDTLADEAAPEAIARAAAQLGCRSVAFTYNDPVIFLEYAIDVADACRELGLKAVAVTAGYMSAEPRAEFYRHIRSEPPGHPPGHRVQFGVGVVDPRDHQIGDLQPHAGLVPEILQGLQHRIQLRQAHPVVKAGGESL